ncbi:MAG TPA: tetratricopeptide repeat protein [Pseudomonadales bacterium]
MKALVLGCALAQAPLFVVSAHAADNVDMAPAVATALNEVIALMDQQQLDAAAAAMQNTRATLQDGMTEYEQFRTLQLSATLNTLRQNLADAIADYEAILGMNALTDADRLATTKLLAELYLQQRDWDKALEHLLIANDLKQDDTEILFRIAYAYGQTGRAVEGLPYMERRVELAGALAPEDDYNNLAILYIQSGNEAKAIATYEKLLEMAPNSANREAVSSNLAALYIKTGNNAKAQGTLRTLLRDFPSSSQAPTWRQSLAAIGG